MQAAGVVRMGDATHMPELGEDHAILLMYRLGDRLPGFDLLRAVDTRSPGVALPQRRDLGAFADDQPRRGTLGVVPGHDGVGQIAGLAGAGAGHGRHEDAVFQLEAAQFDRFKEYRMQWGVGHGGLSQGLLYR